MLESSLFIFTHDDFCVCLGTGVYGDVGGANWCSIFALTRSPRPLAGAGNEVIA